MIDGGAARQALLGALVVLASVDVRIDLEPTSERYRSRIEAATNESLAAYDQWFGPLAPQSLTIGARGDLPWHSPQPFMEVEARIAYEIALRYWRPTDRAAVPIAEGLSWYLQSKIVERLFNIRYATLAHSADGARFFGGHVAWAMPSLRLSRTAGLAPSGARRLPPGVDALTIRGALAFASLERYLGWPVLQSALRSVAAAMGSTPLTRDYIARVFSESAGQDLTWFFLAAFDPAVRFDYAIDQFVTGAAPASCPSATCYRTDVTVARIGNGQFTGTSKLPVGPYEAGQALTLTVAFEDGQAITTRWDGRAARRTFEFESPAAATSVRFDSEGVLLLDRTRLDHVRSMGPRSNVPVLKWVARWMVWLQDAMLTASALV